MATPRRAGARWRVKADKVLPGGRYGDVWHVASDRRFGGGGEDRAVECAAGTFHVRHVELHGTELDEVVVGRWLHLEQMDTGRWWLNIGGVTLWITADRDGNPRSVTVYGPNDYDAPVPGCRYELAWSGQLPAHDYGVGVGSGDGVNTNPAIPSSQNPPQIAHGAMNT